MHPIYPMADGLVRMKPIGVVRSPVAATQTGGFTAVRATVEIDPALSPLLDGYEEFSHLWVVFWFSEVREHSIARRPQGREDVPVVGLLATRCPDRPNPIAFTLVRLVERRANALLVEGLDAIDGTPVLDVKPYYPPYDEPRGDIRVPDYVHKLAY